MSRHYALFLVSALLPACGQPSLPTIQPTVPAAFATALEVEAISVRETVRDAIVRYLARKHAGMVIEKLSVARSAINGRQSFTAICRSPRQVRRIEGHYDVARRVAAVENDTLLP